ncbi:MAG: DUF4157 domain-containing protein [Pseudomonadota bacterium]
MTRPQLQAREPPKPKTKRTVLQPKLVVGPSRDRFEIEADRLADRAIAQSGKKAPAAAPGISRLPSIATQRMQAKATETGASKTGTKELEEEETTKVQRKASGPSIAPQPAEVAIARMRSEGGKPLTSSVRQNMEHGLGTQLGDVRLHQGAKAAKAARDVGARAFTVGRDVFFGAGQYQPATIGGQRLLAHELVHTEQQRGLGKLAQTTAVQRNTDPNTELEDEGPGNEFKEGGVEISLDPNGQGGQITIPKLHLPYMHGGYKGTSNRKKAPGVADPSKSSLTSGDPFVYSGKTQRAGSASAEFQKTQYFTKSETELEPVLVSMLPEMVKKWDRAPEIQNDAGETRRYLRLSKINANSTNTIIYGTTSELGDHKRIKLPNWDRFGDPARFDVDHSHELQLGGLDGWENFWLLDSKANQSSGREIKNKLQSEVDGAISKAEGKKFWRDENASRKPTFNDIKDQAKPWTVTFKGFRRLSIDNASGPYWTRRELLQGKHLKHLVAMSETELINQGLILSGDKPKAVSLFTSLTGGYRKRMRVHEDGSVSPYGSKERFLGGFHFLSADINPQAGTAPYITKLNGIVFRRKKKQVINPTEMSGENGIRVESAEGLGYSGVINNADLMARIRSIPTEVVGASPIEWQEAGFNMNGDLFANGTVTATKLLFPGMQFPIRVIGEDVFVEFPIPTDKLSFGPVSVTEAALQLGVGENGIFVSGNAGIAVNGLGSGMLEARVEDDNTIISGDFNFDLDFLDPAKATATYDYGNDTLSLGFMAGIGDGKIPGVSGGHFTATFSRETLVGSGHLILKGPLAGTIVSIKYSQEEGLKLGADNIPLPVSKIPGVKSAKASLFASRHPETGEWSFSGMGTAEVDVAGASGTLTVAVNGESVTITGGLTIEKGPAKGGITFTATNAPIDEDGNIVEGPPSEDYNIFGRGSAEITFGDIIKGTAGIELQPDTSIKISGSIALAKDYNLFDRKDFSPDRPLVNLNSPEFPIFAVGVGPASVGINASVGGSFSYVAYVGPGKLTNSEISAEMELDKPEEAIVTGKTTFEMEAYAGLVLGVHVNLLARATALYARGTIGIDATAALRADASAEVDVSWSKNSGLEVGARGKASVSPELVFTAWAELAAGVDYLGEKTWDLGSRELGRFGPDLSMGLEVPAKWSEKEGLQFSLDDIVIDTPSLSGRALADEAGERLF